MKGGTFGTWFKELATLVFTQTVQAFLLAVVLSIVISAMSGGSSDEGSATKATMAGGLLAIIALAQFNKLEMLVKSIFGIKSQFSDVMKPNPGGLTAGAMMAWRGAKRLADNGGKIVGGLAGAANSQYRLNKLNKLKDAEDLENQATGADALATGAEGRANLAEGNAALAQAGLDQANEMADALGQDFIEGTNAAAAVNLAYNNDGTQNVSGGNGGGNLGISSTDINNLITALNNQTTALNNNTNKVGAAGAAGAIGTGSGSTSSGNKSIDERIQEAKIARRDSLRKAKTGLNETAGAIGGATVGLAGAAISVGMGKDLGDAAQTVITAAGAGDAVFEKASKTKNTIHDTLKDNKALKVEVKGGTAYDSSYNKVSASSSVKERKAAARDSIASAEVRQNKAAQREASANERTLNATEQKKVVDAINKQIIAQMPKRATSNKQSAKDYNKKVIANIDKRKADASNID